MGVHSAQVIAAAKVPIIKFDDVQSGLAFDISFDVANGPKTAKLVTQMMATLPPMRHLVVVLKLFLQQREMNEVGHGCAFLPICKTPGPAMSLLSKFRKAMY